MAGVRFKRGNKAFIDSLPIVDGQLIFNTETGEIFEDVGDKRILTGGNVTVDSELSTTSKNPVESQVIANAMNQKVSKTGLEQVTQWNIEGFKIADGTDITARTVKHGKGAYMENAGELLFVEAIEDYEGLVYSVIPIEGGKHYTFSPYSRFTVITDSEKNIVQFFNDGITEFDAVAGSSLLLWTTWGSNLGEMKIAVGNAEAAPTEVIQPDWLASKPKQENALGIGNGGFQSERGYIGGTNELISFKDIKLSLRKGLRLTVEGESPQFNSMEVGFRNSDDDSSRQNHFEIGLDDIAYFTGNTERYRTKHGLTLTKNTQVIIEQTDHATATLTLISDGEIFKTRDVVFELYDLAYPYVKYSQLTYDVKLTVFCTDIKRKIWAFGDSYFSEFATRWTYYLREYGYLNNILMDSFAGETGAKSLQSLKTLLKWGKPEYIFWCLGMNDGSDSADAPSAQWVKNRDELLNICQKYEITPIFGIIPNVTRRNNIKKNEWIRASGYRYVDFEKAVGAKPDGTWFPGMQNSDGVHPTPKGARALFGRVLVDFPEITGSGAFSGDYNALINKPVIDSELSKTSTNLVENQAIAKALNPKMRLLKRVEAVGRETSIIVDGFNSSNVCFYCSLNCSKTAGGTDCYIGSDSSYTSFNPGSIDAANEQLVTVINASADGKVHISSSRITYPYYSTEYRSVASLRDGNLINSLEIILRGESTYNAGSYVEVYGY